MKTPDWDIIWRRLPIYEGEHSDGDGDRLCAMEMANALASAVFNAPTDSAGCVADPITEIAIGLNDNAPSQRQRQRLVRLIPYMIGTKTRRIGSALRAIMPDEDWEDAFRRFEILLRRANPRGFNRRKLATNAILYLREHYPYRARRLLAPKQYNQLPTRTFLIGRRRTPARKPVPALQ